MGVADRYNVECPDVLEVQVGQGQGGVWRGAVHPNDSIVWTFVAQVGPGLAAGSPLTATMQVEIEDISLRFSRAEVTHVGQPVLQSNLTLVPKSPRWNSIITATLITQNLGNRDAPQTTLNTVVPTGLHLLTDTIQLQGGGQIALGNTENGDLNLFSWVGTLADSGEEIRLKNP